MIVMNTLIDERPSIMILIIHDAATVNYYNDHDVIKIIVRNNFLSQL